MSDRRQSFTEENLSKTVVSHCFQISEPISSLPSEIHIMTSIGSPVKISLHPSPAI